MHAHTPTKHPAMQ